MTFAYRFYISIASATWVFCTFKHNNDLITKKKNDQGIGSSRNHLSTFLYFKILQYDYRLLSLHTLLLYESLSSNNPETIVIVSTGRPNIELL